MPNEYTNVNGVNIKTSYLNEKGKTYCDKTRIKIKSLIIIFGFIDFFLFISAISGNTNMWVIFGIVLLFITAFVLILFTEYSTKKYLYHGIKLYREENQIFDDKYNSNVKVLVSDKIVCLSKNENVYFYMSLKGQFQLYIGNYYTKIYNSEELLDFEIRDNQTLIINKKIFMDSYHNGGLGGAIIGGALFGGAGMVAGAVLGRNRTTSYAREKGTGTIAHNYKLVLKVISLSTPVIKAKLETEKEADEVASLILRLIKDGKTSNSDKKFDQDNKKNQQSFSVPEEIRKYKELLDDGIITQEEYEEKKKQLLGIK